MQPDVPSQLLGYATQALTAGNLAAAEIDRNLIYEGSRDGS
jgi:hypothetical protein